ncbi:MULTISPECIES: hypothetical protein [unclassified Kribbella]|uniref:hypothetical protein n=1 Tax=unclassified Kribbella TaxID=2644121 RepID=UPI00301A3C08
MLISRRALGTLAGGVVLGLVAGCGKKTPEQASADRLEWLRGLDGVEKAELVAPDGEQIRLTLTSRLPDADVSALVDKIKREFRPHDEGYNDSIEVAIDGYHGRFYPSASTKRDPDLERALWLRRDGRATGSTYGASGLIVTAPAAAVAAVALGFDQVVPSEDARRTHRVESADLQVVVEWTDSPSLGFRLDRSATQYFADLQTKYPHLTGWIEGPQRRAGVYFAATDVALDAVPKLVDAKRFGELTLGWGPVRAPHAVFAKALTPQVRMLIGHLMKIPGVTGVEIDEDGEVASVTVKDRAGYVAAVSTLRKVWDYLPIQLIRRPSRLVGRPGNAVFRSSAFDRDRQFRIYATLADLTGVTRVEIGPESTNLTIAPDITDADLVTTLQAMAQLPPANPIRLFVSDGPDDVGVTAIGSITNRKYVPRQPVPSKIDPTLITRLTTTWPRATR